MKRLLLIGMLVVQSLSASAQVSAPTRAEAIALVIQAGGRIEFEGPGDAGSVRKIDLNRTQVTDEQLAALRGFPELQVLDLRLTTIGDAGVRHLAALGSLRSLNLFRTKLTDQGLRDLGTLVALETLLIGGTGVTDEGMKSLSALRSLHKLSVFDTRVGDLGVARLAGLESLQVLLVDRSAVTAEGRAALRSVNPSITFTEPIT